MVRTFSLRILLWGTLASLGIVLAGTDRPAVGQDTKPEVDKAEAEPAAPAKAKKFRGRLPNYYRQVVDEKQRQTIYQIQEEYASKIAALRAQLAAVTKERDEKVAAVLTPEQLKKVEELAAEAKAKRERKKSAK